MHVPGIFTVCGWPYSYRHCPRGVLTACVPCDPCVQMPCVALIGVGFLSSKVTNKLIVGVMTRVCKFADPHPFCSTAPTLERTTRVLCPARTCMRHICGRRFASNRWCVRACVRACSLTGDNVRSAASFCCVAQSPVKQMDVIFTPALGMFINNYVCGMWTHIDQYLDLDQKDSVFIYGLVAFAVLNHGVS